MTVPQVRELLERSHRLGADRRNTNWAGGNASVKGPADDPVTGRPVELLWVKGSGGDLGTLTEQGLSILRLDRLRSLVGVYPGADREDEMASAFDYCLHGRGGAAPSIDTAMHGLVTAAHVDHLHPESGIALATAADGEALTKQCFGGRVAWVPWRRPGFQLGLDVAAIQRANEDCVGVVLGGHGITAWGSSSRECEARSLEIIRGAERFIAERGRPEPFGAVFDGFEPLAEGARQRRAAALGTSCPDHFLRTKVRPMVLDLPPSTPLERVVERLRELHAAYREAYQAYYGRHASPDSPPMRGADPAIVLVPGAGSGIGRAISERLAAEGACVVVADLDAGSASAVAGGIGDADAAVAVAADVSDEDQVADAVERATLAFGEVDLVVNNAGLSISKPLLETSAGDWDRQHDVMARGSFLVSREAARVMIAQGLGGDLVYVVSKNGVVAGPDNLAYGAAKADQAHQVRLLAAELGRHGIRVNGVNPDAVVRGSGIFAKGWGAQRAAVYGVPEEELGAFYAKRTLLGREVLPEHVAAAVLALVAGDLSRTTGLLVPVDAGVAAAFLR